MTSVELHVVDKERSSTTWRRTQDASSTPERVEDCMRSGLERCYFRENGAYPAKEDGVSTCSNLSLCRENAHIISWRHTVSL
jgi:hypothetical protein